MPFHRRTLAAAAALALVLASLGACTADGLFSARSSGTQTFDEAVEAGPPDLQVRVEMFNGAIEVRAGAADRIRAEVETTGVGASRDEAEQDRARIKVTLDVDPDGTVLLRAVYEPNPGSPNNRSAGAVVEVPPGTALDLRTSNGAVSTAGIVGSVDARTSNGAVRLAGTKAGATVRTSNGSVDVDGSGLLDVETSNGRVDIRGDGATVRVATSNASLGFEGTFSAGAQQLESSNGGITVRLPAGASFGLDARTSNATITLDGFSILATGASSGGSLQGTVGTGGPSVTLRTSNAAIVVSAQ